MFTGDVGNLEVRLQQDVVRIPVFLLSLAHCDELGQAGVAHTATQSLLRSTFVKWKLGIGEVPG